MGYVFQDVVETHPGLTFLKDAPEFHSRYITTVGWMQIQIDSIHDLVSVMDSRRRHLKINRIVVICVAVL